MNTHSAAWYVTESDCTQSRPWDITDHNTSLTELDTKPVLINRDNRYVKGNYIIDDSNLDFMSTKSKMPANYVFVENETVYNHWRKELADDPLFPLKQETKGGTQSEAV